MNHGTFQVGIMVYALNTRLDLKDGFSKDALEKAMDGPIPGEEAMKAKYTIMNGSVALMKYFIPIAERIGGLIISFGVFMAGVTGSFQSDIFNGISIIGGLVGIGASIFALITKQDKKEVDEEEQAQTEKRAAEIMKQEALVQRMDVNAESLTEIKTILIEIPPFTLKNGIILELRLNGQLIGEMDSTRRSLRFTTDLTRNHITFVNKQTGWKSKYCLFKVTAVGEGYITYIPDDAFMIKEKSGLASDVWDNQ